MSFSGSNVILVILEMRLWAKKDILPRWLHKENFKGCHLDIIWLTSKSKAPLKELLSSIRHDHIKL